MSGWVKEERSLGCVEAVTNVLYGAGSTDIHPLANPLLIGRLKTT